VYLKGNLGDFDNWARNTKDSSWKNDNLLPHFQRAEDIVSPTPLAVRKSLMSTSKTLGTLDTKRRKHCYYKSWGTLRSRTSLTSLFGLIRRAIMMQTTRLYKDTCTRCNVIG
jgi:hypothetical protein